MDENIQKIKTRYPFGGFYLEFLTEEERNELASMPEEMLLTEPPKTTELPNTVPPAESAAIEPVPQPALETIPADAISATVQEGACLEAAVPKNQEEEPQPAEEPVWISDLSDDEKALVLINDWATLRKLKDLYGDAVGCYCSVNNIKGQIDALEDCIKDGKLQKRIVFTTEVLYNGISIKDKDLFFKNRYIKIDLLSLGRVSLSSWLSRRG